MRRAGHRVVCGVFVVGCLGMGVLAASPSSSDQPADKLPLDIVRPLVDARKHAEAEKVAREILATSETLHGANSLRTGQALDALIHVLLDIPDPPIDEIRPLIERCLTVKEASVGREHLEFAISINNSGRFYLKIANYEQARACFTEVVRIREKILGPRHMDVAKALNNLAVVLVRMGEYTDARPIYDRVIGIFKESGARDYPEIASVMTNLGLLLRRTGDYEAARRMFEEVLRIQEAALGPDAPQVGGTLGNLADVTHQLGDFPACRRYWERVMTIWTKEPGKESTAYAAALAELGNTLLYLGEPVEGGRMIDQALAIHERLNFMNTRETASYLNYKAYSLALQGKMQEAKELYQRSLDLQRSLLGPDHPYVASHVFNLAQQLHWMGNRSGALDQALLSERITREHMSQTFPILSERQAINFEMARRPAIDLGLTILVEKSPDAPLTDAIKRVWDPIVRSRAMVLDEMTARARNGAALPGEAGNPQAERLALARRRVSRVLVLGPGNAGLESYQNELKKAVDDRERAERDLAQVSSSYGQRVTRSRAGLDDVIRALPRDMALVAYVKFNRQGQVLEQNTEWYMALTLDAGSHETRVVPIGTAAEVESAVDSWRREAGSNPRSFDTEESVSAYRRAAQHLRALIWDPAWSKLQAPKKVIVVPDGALSLVNIATLVDEDGKYLIETGPTLHYMASERDLLRDQQPHVREASLLIVGGPDFDSPSVSPGSVTATVKTDAKPAKTTISYRRPRSLCGAFGDLRFEPLPQAREEADEVARLWTASGRVRKLTGSQADEATLKTAAPDAQVIHISTHAFFMAGKCGEVEVTSGTRVDSRGTADLEYTGASLPEEFLVFSGLALAGANLRPGDNTADVAAEDGILTAEEISGLDLSKAQWVVLSACETGIGKYLPGEGILGLRRAFESASARTLIMSLWQVEDNATRAWMTGLYKARLRGLDTPESVRNASLELLRKHGRTSVLRHPFFWGAFVASGDWR